MHPVESTHYLSELTDGRHGSTLTHCMLFPGQYPLDGDAYDIVKDKKRRGIDGTVNRFLDLQGAKDARKITDEAQGRGIELRRLVTLPSDPENRRRVRLVNQYAGLALGQETRFTDFDRRIAEINNSKRAALIGWAGILQTSLDTGQPNGSFWLAEQYGSNGTLEPVCAVHTYYINDYPHCEMGPWSEVPSDLKEHIQFWRHVYDIEDAYARAVHARAINTSGTIST